VGTQFSAPNINRRSVLHFDLAELKELKQSRNPVLMNRQESRQIVDWFSPRLYITGLRVYDVRPVRRVLLLRLRGFTLSSGVAVRSRFSDHYDYHDFGGLRRSITHGFSVNIDRDFGVGLLNYVRMCFLYFFIIIYRWAFN